MSQLGTFQKLPIQKANLSFGLGHLLHSNVSQLGPFPENYRSLLPGTSMPSQKGESWRSSTVNAMVCLRWSICLENS